jgi:hypothetical protein
MPNQAAHEYRRATRRVLVLTRGQVAPISATGIVVQPAYEWLLTAPA